MCPTFQERIRLGDEGTAPLQTSVQAHRRFISQDETQTYPVDVSLETLSR